MGHMRCCRCHHCGGTHQHLLQDVCQDRLRNLPLHVKPLHRPPRMHDGAESVPMRSRAQLRNALGLWGCCSPSRQGSHGSADWRGETRRRRCLAQGEGSRQHRRVGCACVFPAERRTALRRPPRSRTCCTPWRRVWRRTALCSLSALLASLASAHSHLCLTTARPSPPTCLRSLPALCTPPAVHRNVTMAASAPEARKWAHVLPPFWKDTITAYLKDDAPTFDVGGFVVGGEGAGNVAAVCNYRIPLRRHREGRDCSAARKECWGVGRGAIL